MKHLLLSLLLALPLAAFTAEPPAPGADCPQEVAAAHYPQRAGPLTQRELAMARTAWKYFENNTQPTGLANAVDHYPSTTMWDTASYLAAIVAARELGLATAQDADGRLAKLFDVLGGLSFFRGELPNKVYHTQTLEKSDYANRPGEIGFSA